MKNRSFNSINGENCFGLGSVVFGTLWTLSSLSPLRHIKLLFQFLFSCPFRDLVLLRTWLKFFSPPFFFLFTSLASHQSPQLPATKHTAVDVERFPWIYSIFSYLSSLVTHFSYSGKCPHDRLSSPAIGLGYTIAGGLPSRRVMPFKGARGNSVPINQLEESPN